jgi:8-hydroxy-5-deazaflavin:NADPH oxidoreductase
MTTMTIDRTTTTGVGDLAIAVLGGTGDQGRGLSYRFARAGQRVIIGSRSAERGETAAREVAGLAGVAGAVTGSANVDAAAAGDLAIIAVPWEGHADTVAALAGPLAGKIVVDCVNPLGFDERGPYPLRVPEGSAAEQAASLLRGSTVCAAFHHVSAAVLADPAVDRVDLDVLVLGDDRDAVAVVVALAGRIDGVRGVYAGRLRNAGQVEALTANLIAINRRYKTHAGVRITNL